MIWWLLGVICCLIIWMIFSHKVCFLICLVSGFSSQLFSKMNCSSVLSIILSWESNEWCFQFLSLSLSLSLTHTHTQIAFRWTKVKSTVYNAIIGLNLKKFYCFGCLICDKLNKNLNYLRLSWTYFVF